MKRYNYIYRTVNLKNSKFYIGQHSTNKIYDSYLGSGSKLKKDIKKYGINNFIKGVIEFCEYEDLNDKEIYWIDFYNSIEYGYNICKGGGDYPILYGEDNPFYGKKHSEETKKLLSKKRKDRCPWNKGLKGCQSHSKETRRKMSENRKGEKHPNFGKKGELCKIYGIKRTKVTKKKLSESKKGDKNPNVAKLEILSPDNKKFIIDYGIPKFLKKYKYDDKKWVLYHAIRLGEYRGWKINKLDNF